MTVIGLLRHFPTDWNGEGRLQGQVDRPLTPAALEQLAALALPAAWRTAPCLASPLSRARRTAEILTGGPVPTDARLVEQSWGAWEGRLSAELAADPASGFTGGDEMAWDARPPEGESKADVAARVAPLMADLAAAGQGTLLVAHKALMRVVLHLAAGDAAPPVKRARIYPVELDTRGRPVALAEPVRLVPRG